MKLGLFGGTFDPIHWGHLRSAEEIAEAHGLDLVEFVTAGIPPHRRHAPGAAASHRYEMVRLAVEDNPRFKVSDVEISRSGVSYSIDTVRFFRSQMASTDSLYFIMGLDAFRFIDSWKDFSKLFELTSFLVTSRPGGDNDFSFDSIPIAVRDRFCYDLHEKTFRHESGNLVSFTKITDIHISASQIRGLLRHGKSIRYLIPPSVERYIEARHLYRE